MNQRTYQAVIAFALFIASLQLPAAPMEPLDEQVRGQTPMLENNIDRPLRYFPQGTDFVITNGPLFFNRPLYGGNTAFRVDAGDSPEFSLYLPGRGGNLRLGIKTEASAKWLFQAKEVIARYRPGAMVYEVRDPLLGSGALHLEVLATRESEGLLVKAELRGTQNSIELICAFGGVNGERGRRDGDIGCETKPVSEFFQLRPEQCASNLVVLGNHSFAIRGRPGLIGGVLPANSVLSIGDAAKWNNPAALLDSSDPHPNQPVAVARFALPFDQVRYIGIQRLASGENADAALQVYREVADQTNSAAPALNTKPWATTDMPALFESEEAQRRAIVDRVTLDTPNPFINAAAGALNIAADAVWDDRLDSFMHGGVAWRVRLLGWRGPYSGDALGWHERTAAHFEGYARQQNTSPVPDEVPAPEASANLSRNENALHSNGDLTKSHYDMNLVAVDAFFRHLLWTGDLEFARRNWPVIERHLAWERRLFRREFGPDKLPLYEAYAAIWASDDLAYNGGGATHSSAYNFYHNQMAARVAKLIGKDPIAYEREADLIARAMRNYLWLPETGTFAEWKDYLGEQRVHPNPAAWTFYHTMDSEVPTPTEAWRMSRFMDTHLARIPIRGPNVPPGNFTIPTTSWMPYTWSLNNVVMAESMHTALAYWQANRVDAALPLFQGALLDSMFLGLCPGNVGMTTFYDAYRRESQRDFADGVGMTSRALVEGLFGIHPDALAGELRLHPGFPASWDHASIQHPDFQFAFRRDGARERYTWDSKFSKPMKLHLQINAQREGVASVTVNGQPAIWKRLEDVVGSPRIEITGTTANLQEIVVEWKGAIIANTPTVSARPKSEAASSTMDWNQHFPADTRFDLIDLTTNFNDRVTQIFRNEYLEPRSPFCSLAKPKQGIGSWCHPTDSFAVDDSGLRVAAARGNGRIVTPNGIPLATPSDAAAKNILFTSQWKNYPVAATVALSGKASHAFLLMAGSTDAMQSRSENGEVVIAYRDGSRARLPLVNPINWWPIDQDYFIDDFAFRRPEPIPPRVNLKTGQIRVLDVEQFKGKGGTVPGGAATVLDLPLDPTKELESLTLHTIANEVVIGLMSLTLER